MSETESGKTRKGSINHGQESVKENYLKNMSHQRDRNSSFQEVYSGLMSDSAVILVLLRQYVMMRD